VAFPPSGRVVRDLAAVVEIPALPMVDARQDLAFGSAMGPEFIGHDDFGHVALTLQQLAKETLGRRLVVAALHQHTEHVAVLINGSPEIMQFALNGHEHFIQKPFVSGLRPPPLQGPGVGSSEAQALLADRLVADNDAACCQNQIDSPQAEAESVVKPNRLVNDFGRKAEAPVKVGWRAHA
jgi:hypothetical protein